MEIHDRIHSLRLALASLRLASDPADPRPCIGLVPTMGNLHQGHLDLVAACRQQAKHCVVSIFVNPLQFGVHEDFDAYPRTLAADAEKLQAAGVSLLFTPSDAELYPQGRQDQTRVHVPGLADILCGASRPGHFDGVATVVLKLFNIVQPDLALFGEKDYQQLQLLKKMVAQLNLPLQISGVATARADDGLALSSRNQYLSPEERARAPALRQTLLQLGAQLQQGERDFVQLQQQARAQLLQAGFVPDYLEIRHPDSLAVAQPDDTRFVILAAAQLGKARLLDNLQVSPP